MKEIQVLLKIFSDGLKTIAQRVETISEKVDEIAKSQSEARSKVKKGRPATVPKKTGDKTSVNEPKQKAAKAPTAAETVFSVISRSKKGVDTATLMKKTGYDRKKIGNMQYRLGRQGKIKTVEKGVYMKV